MLKRLFSFWFLPIFWMGLIFLASSFHTLRASAVAWQDFAVRKTAHFLEYAVLFGLYFRALKNTTGLSLARVYLWSFLLTFLYALSDEFHQTLVSGRTGMLKDVMIDIGGGLLGGSFLANFWGLTRLKE